MSQFNLIGFSSSGANVFNNLTITENGAMVVPYGVSSERPVAPVAGMLRYNTIDNGMEYYNGTSWLAVSQQPPTISSITPQYVQDNISDNSINIIGDNFSTNPFVQFISSVDNSVISAQSQTFNSTSSITAVISNAMRDLSGLYPFSVKVTNDSSLTSTLANALSWNEVPTFTTAQSPSIYAEIPQGTGFLSGQLDLSAVDPGLHYPLNFISSDLSGNTSNYLTLESSGAIIGDASLLSAANYNFSAKVTDTNNGFTLSNFTFQIYGFIQATGGDVVSTYTDGAITYKYHIFKTTGTSNFNVSAISSKSSYNNVDYLIVGAGGGGWGSPDCCVGGGGGGAGGVLQGTNTSLSATTYTTNVGIGVNGGNGNSSSIFSLTAYGGGRGANYSVPGNGQLPGGGGSNADGATVGSGGGAAFTGNLGSPVVYPGGTGTAGQGKDGGSENPVAPNYYGGGGGGAGENGYDDDDGSTPGNGGNGVTTTIITTTIATNNSVGEVNGGNIYFGGGGGSSVRTNSYSPTNLVPGRPGGLGGGGTGKDNDNQPPSRFNGVANTGGGGGGGKGGSARTGSGPDNSTGGSGVIILRYRFS